MTVGVVRLSRSLLAAALAVLACALVVSGFVSVAPVHAQTRLTVGGGGPYYFPKIVAHLPLGRFYFTGTGQELGPPLSFLDGYDVLTHMIGENWFPGTTAQMVDYPASMGLLSGSLVAPGVDVAVAEGRAALDEQIKNATSAGDPVVIAGLSEGTLVINRELASLATDPHAPPADRLSFALLASPETGLFDHYLPVGATLPFVNYTVHGLADSQYDVSVVFHQYDGWADPPDRPWNLLAVVNSVLGMLYFHDGTTVAAPADVVEVSSVTSKLGGTTTTYMVPSPTLPLLMPLQQLGVAPRIINGLNTLLKPVIDAGYSRLAPDAGPYFSHGRLVGLPSIRAVTGVEHRTVPGALDAAPTRQALSVRRGTAGTRNPPSTTPQVTGTAQHRQVAAGSGHRGAKQSASESGPGARP